MALIEADVRKLIDRKAESRSLDYKGHVTWNKSRGSDEQLGIVKDVLAFANTQDGGAIVFGVDRDTHLVCGLSEEEIHSFDTTSLNDQVHRFCDPAHSGVVGKFEIDGKWVVVIEVPEFKEVPILCKADAHSSKDSSKALLRKGAVYIRTDKATSEEIRSAEHMRDLLSRATVKKGDELLRTIERLIKGKPANVPPDVEEFYRAELEESRAFLEQNICLKAKGFGYWEIVALPSIYQARRVDSLPEIANLVEESQVRLRGWYFPHIDNKNVSNFGSGRQSHTIWNEMREGWRAYQSGLFCWQGVLWEDTDDPKMYGMRGDFKFLEFTGVTFLLTEALLFLKRFYAEKLQVENVRVRITLNGCGQRHIISGSSMRPLFGDYVSVENTIVLEEEINRVELNVSFKEIALKYAKKIFYVFNWDSVKDEMIDNWQTKLLERKL